PRREERFAVIAKHDSYEMGLLGDGAVYVLLGRLDGDDSYTAVTRGDEVVAARWSHLRVTYDGVSLAVEVDGIEREWFPDGFHLIDPDDWPPFPDVVPASDGDLTVSHQLRFFMGLIDEPKVRVALEPRSYSLPSGIELLGRERTIRFDSRGSLDPLYHSRPVVVRVADLPDEEDPGEPRKGTTAVAPRPPPGPRGGAAGAESLDPGDVGDPMRALARYVAENTERGSLDGDPQGVGGIGDGSPGGAGAPLSPGVEGDLERGRVQTIIVDLTGTIRG
ncbi:MAG: hypothetical protein ACE5GW_12420, partial [Planctomycetota bacterium]